MNARLSALLLSVLFGFLVLFFGYSLTSRGSDLPQGQLKIQAAPAAAKISIDGKGAKTGENTVDIGQHRVTVTMDGFKPYASTVNITQANETYIGAVLTSSEPSTKNWYKNNPSDQQLLESISGNQFDNSNAVIARKYPLFSALPAIFGNGLGGLTKIESEAALNDSGTPSIGIYASSPQQRQEALDWINTRDYILSNLDVVFYDSQIPLQSGIPE